MDDRVFGPILGMLTSLVSFEIWQNLLVSFAVAFVGGVAAWIARRMCDSISRKIHAKKEQYEEERN